MRLLFFLTTLLPAYAGVIERDEPTCDGIMINGVYHEKEVLKSDLDRPYQLAVDFNTNVLYFSYTESERTEEDVFSTARYDLNRKEFKVIKGVINGFSQAVDQVNKEVYLGGSEGIYKYDPIKDEATLIAKDLNIWTLYFKEVLYYSTFPTQFFYTYIDGESVKFKDLEDTKVDSFAIDGDEMFFTNNTGLYSQKIGTKNATLYRTFPEIGVRGMTNDKKGSIYVCLQDGIYSVNKDTKELVKYVDIDDAFGVAFDDRNNLIYADAVSVVRLIPNKNKKCEPVQVPTESSQKEN